HAKMRLVHLAGTKQLLSARIAARKAHFMPPALLESQFATLEVPDPDENALTISVAKSPKQIMKELARTLA
ncbi:MAG: gluconokinase, partial [Bosea sp. (in: a-proteobacteria)]